LVRDCKSRKAGETKDWWQSIDKGLQDAENGKLIDYAKARKLYEKWL